MRQANLLSLVDANVPEDIARAAAPLQAALPQRWDDALAHQQLALLLIGQYQSETYHRLVAEQRAIRAVDDAEQQSSTIDGDIDPSAEATDPDLWARASLSHLHRTLRQLERDENRAAITTLVGSEPVQQLLAPAVRHFLAARQYAPTISRVHYRLAELSPVFPTTGDEQRDLQRAQLLAPGDATLWYWSGVLDLNSGRVGQACDCWHRSLLLSRTHLHDIMRTSRGRLTVRQLLEQTLPREADLLLQVARKFFAGEDLAKIRQIILQRAQDSLDHTTLPTAELEYTRAAILNLQGRGEEAMPVYADAIVRQSNNLVWRYEFARLLIDLKHYDEAFEQVNYSCPCPPRVESVPHSTERI